MMIAQSPPAPIARAARACSLILRVSGSATMSRSSLRSFQWAPRRIATSSNGKPSSDST